MDGQTVANEGQANDAATEAAATGEIPRDEALDREVSELLDDAETGSASSGEEDPKELTLQHFHELRGIFEDMMQARVDMAEAKEELKQRKARVEELRKLFDRRFEQGPQPQRSEVEAAGDMTPELEEQLMREVKQYSISVIADYGVSEKQVEMLVKSGMSTMGDFIDLMQQKGETWYQDVDGVGPGKRDKFEDAVNDHIIAVRDKIMAENAPSPAADAQSQTDEFEEEFEDEFENEFEDGDDPESSASDASESVGDELDDEFLSDTDVTSDPAPEPALPGIVSKGPRDEIEEDEFEEVVPATLANPNVEPTPKGFGSSEDLSNSFDDPPLDPSTVSSGTRELDPEAVAPSNDGDDEWEEEGEIEYEEVDDDEDDDEWEDVEDDDEGEDVDDGDDDEWEDVEDDDEQA